MTDAADGRAPKIGPTNGILRPERRRTLLVCCFSLEMDYRVTCSKWKHKLICLSYYAHSQGIEKIYVEKLLIKDINCWHLLLVGEPCVTCSRYVVRPNFRSSEVWSWNLKPEIPGY